MAVAEWRGRRFVIRRARVDEERRRLGIVAPVELKLTCYTNQRGTVGCLIGLRDGVWRIALDTYVSAAEASRTVYHELAHIVEAQRLGGMQQLVARHDQELRAAHVIGPRKLSHLRAGWTEEMPIEREAEKLAVCWHEEAPLAEPQHWWSGR